MTEDNIVTEESTLPEIVGYTVDCSTGMSTPVYDSEEYQANLLLLQEEANLMRQSEQNREDAKAALAAASGLTQEQINLLF
jgi:hypothetical protein